MHRTRTRAIAAAAVLLIAPLLALASVQPSGALPVGRSSSCKNSENPAAELGMYPASPASQSQLKVSCLFETDSDFPGGGGYPAGSAASGSFTIHDFDVAVYHNGAARVITATGGLSGSNTISFATFATDPITGWVNRAITGTGIAARTFVTSVSATTITLSENLTANASGQYRIDNAPGARSIDSGSLVDVAGVTHLQTAAGVGTSGNFQNPADVGLSVGGTRVANTCTISAFVSANDVALSCVHNGSPSTFNGQTISIGGSMLVTSVRRVDDALSVSASRISTIGGHNAASDIGLRVYGTGLDADSTISAVAGAGLKNLDIVCASAPCNNNAVNAPIANLRIGDRTGTSAVDDEQVMDLGTQLDLAPSFVPGTSSCSLEEPEGFHIVGTWRNPDNFAAAAFGGTIPSANSVIGQIYVFNPIPGSDFAGYVVQKAPGSAGDPDGAGHYDIVFPNLPVALASCPQDPDGAGPLTTTDYDAPGQGVSLTVNATTPAPNSIPTGVGRPGTAQFRALKAYTGGASTLFMVSDAGPTWVPAANFSRLCAYPATAVVSFTCGNG